MRATSSMEWETIMTVSYTHLDGETGHLRGDGDEVVLLVVGLDAHKNFHAVLDGGLVYNDGLEAALQRGVLLDIRCV